MSPIKVLIVEDDKTSVLTMRKMLTHEGYDIIDVASSGEEAVTLAMEHAPDIILMDISIEGEIDGVEAANAIQQFASTPIIYMSGYTDTDTINRAKKTTPFGYILKPFSKKELDITVQMALYKNQVDAQLKESEIRLSTILANIPNAVIHINAQQKVIYMNPTAEKYLAKSVDQLRGKSIWDQLEIKDIDTQMPLEAPSEFVFQNKSSSNKPIILDTPKNPEKIAEIWGAQLYDPMGEVNGYVMMLKDITQEYQNEQNIHTMASALASLEDSVIITQAGKDASQLKIIYANEGFENLTHKTQKSLIGAPIFSVFNPKNAHTFFELIQETINTGKPFQSESIHQMDAENDNYLQWSISPIKNKEQKTDQLVFTIRDITHIRRLEENIRQSQKIEAVGRLAGGIAHDFNNLLSVINSYSDLQMLKLDQDSPAMKYAQQIRSAGKKGADLVSQLMTFSRRDKPEPSLLDLREVTEEIRGMLSRLIRENIHLDTIYAEDAHSIRADQGQIEQILINLCVNARDAMPSGGNITIRVENRFTSQEEADKLGYLRPGNYVVLSVEDTGCGMDPETIKHIFDPFFTTKEIGKGTGLGLSTVYGIIKQLGGFANVDSEIGKGTTFELHFPSTYKEDTTAEQDEHVEEIPQGNEIVMVVEDDETFLDCISGLLSLHGYIVYSASDGNEAQQLLKTRADEIQLLITDLVVPQMPGREIANRLLELNPKTKVIFMTGYDDQLDSFYSFPDKFPIMEKPFPLNTLLQRVRAILDEPEI